MSRFYIPHAPTKPSEPTKPIDLSNTNHQSQCPLFHTVPAEIRNEIFALALQDFVDREQLYGRNDFYARPGFEGPSKVDLRLLRTCKRVYAETRGMVWKGVEMVFYGGMKERKPPEYKFQSYARNNPGVYIAPYVHKAAANNQEFPKTDCVRFIAQMFAFKGNIMDLLNTLSLSPTTVILTVRYTDWWWWENNMAPNLEDFLVIGQTKLPNSVTKVFLELENREGNRKHLDAIVKQLLEDRDRSDRRWDRQDGRILKFREGEKAVGEWRWKGPTKIDGVPYVHHGEGDEMDYVVKVLKWELAPKE